MSYNSQVKSATELFDDSDDVVQPKSATIPENKISSATKLFDDSDVDEYPSFKAAPKGEYNRIGPLPMPEYTGSKGEEYLAQFMSSAARGLAESPVTLANMIPFIDRIPIVKEAIEKYEKKAKPMQAAPQGLPGEPVVRGAGRAAGSAPALMLAAGGVGAILKGALSKLPTKTKILTGLGIRLGVTTASFGGALMNSMDFYDAMKRGDADAMEDAAAFTLIDLAFAGFMSKGLIEDANNLKLLRAEAMEERFRRAKNITPEEPPPPKTLAEESARVENPPVKPSETVNPSPELVTKVDSQENIAKVSKASKDIKAKARKNPETEIARKEKTVAQIKARTDAELKKTEKQKVDVTVRKPTSATELFSDTEMMKEVSPKTVEAIQKRVTEKLQPRETIMAESTGGGTQDSWLLRTRSGARMEVTFGDETVYVDQVSVPKAMQRKGVASQLYERLGEMMKQRGIPGSAIEGNIQGPPEAITKLRARAASIAGEGKPGEGRYEIDLGEEAEPEVPLKINETVAEGPKLTGAQYDEMEKIYGKDLTELTDQDVSDYLASKAKPSGEIKLAKRVKEISDEDVEKFYGKPVEEISDEEIDKFFEITPEFEEIRDVDTQIGVEEPPELVSEESSIFRQDPETTKASVDNYKRSQSVAKTINELLVKDPTKPQKDVGPTTWSLITQVNHWLNGGETDIGETRNFLSNLATRADEFRWQFDQPGMNSAESQEAFDNWKELVSDAAVWARRVDRGKLQMMRSGGPSTEEIAKVIRGWYSALKNYAQEKLGNRATGKQIKATLRKGATQDEWSNVGLDAMLKDDVVYDKMEVLKKIDEGTVEFKDVELGLDLDPGMRNEFERVRTDIENTASVAPLAAKKPIHYMYSGGPSTDDLIAAAIKAARAFRDSMIRDVKAEKMAGKEIHRNVKEELVKALVERSGNIAKILTSPESYKKYGDFGYRIVRNMYLSKGATPRATNAYRQFAKEVYGGLNRRESEIVDRLAMAVRMVDIGKYKSPKQFKFPEGKDPNSSALYLASFGQIEGLTPERAFELYHTNKDGTIGGRVGAGFEAIRRTIKDMRDEAGGLIGAKEHDDLIAHKYRRLGTIDNPTTLASIFDKEYRQTVGDIARNVYDSGIEKLAQGHETDIFKPSWKLMTFETLVRAYGRLANNEANHTLLELAKAFPDNPFVRTKIRPTQELSTQPFKRGKLNESIQIKRLEQGVSDYELKELVKTVAKKNISYKRASIDELKAIDNALGPISKGYAEKAETIPRGWVPTYGYDKGHRTTAWMEPSFAKEWIVNSKDITPRAARVLKWLTMAPITRMFATGIDPGFALANLPRDMLHLWFAAREYVNGQWKPVYSSVSAVYAEQLGEDLAAVSNDALTRKGWWDDYVKYGGGMDFLVLQGRPFQKGVRIDNSLDEVINYLGYLNESSEIVTRLAITRRALINAAARNGMTLEEARNNPEMMRDAVFAARDYMDFSQGGWLVKFVDQFIPYFNASVLGMRTFTRSFKSGKNVSQKSWWKLGQFAMLVAGLYVASKKWAPETMKELKGDINSQNNIILPLGDTFGFEDEMGQKRYPYLKIPLDPSVRALKKFFEFTTDEAMGEETDVAGTFNAIKQISPVEVSALPPLENAIFEYFANYDTYKMRAIRRDEEKFSWPKSREEYSKDTPQALVDIGKVTGASPDRIKVAMSEMISSSSVWAQLLGEAYNKMFGQMPEDLREKHLAESLAKFPLTGRFMGLTNPYTRFAESIEKASEDAAFDRFIQRRNLDILIDGYLYKKSVDREKIELYMRSFNDKQVYDRLDDRFKFAERTADMPHRSLWLRMEALNNEARARIYVEQIFDNPQLLSEFNDVNNRMRHTSRGGLSTEGFRREVSRLQAKSGESE